MLGKYVKVGLGWKSKRGRMLEEKGLKKET